MESSDQGHMFGDWTGSSEDRVVINEYCSIHTAGGHRVVSVAGITLIHYSVGDKAAEAYAMVCLVEQGWALQNEVSQAFGCSERTVRRHQWRFEAGGLAALGRPRGYPKGKPRLPSSDGNQLNGWKGGGVSNREMGRRLGICEKAVRNRLRRLGWRPEVAEQTALPSVEGADPKLSGSDASASQDEAQYTVNTDNTACDDDGPQMPEGADPKLSGPAAEPPSVPLPSFDVDPDDRRIDRVLACMGLLDDAAPMFGTAQRVPGAGVLLAVPALAESGVLEVAREVYGSLAPAFYGLRTTIVTFLLLALLRIKRTEGLKEHSPQQLGRLLGLDRAPEVKTLRRKLRRLAALGRAADFGRALARRRIESRGHAMGFLYVDGHVRAYHGKREIPKTHVARMRIAMPATTDYWVNDAEGDPLFVVTTEANKGLVKMLPEVLEQVRELVGDRKVTVVFDRGGWSPKLFAQLLEEGFDILTYRKGKSRRVAKRHFQLEQAVIDGHEVSYWLADQGIYLFYGQTKKRKRLKLRQVTRLSNDGHQTPIVTSRRDLPSVEVAYRMFERWRQENFFKYLREEYALDALVDYGTEPADPTRSVPNPAHRQINAELRKARAELAQIQAEYGLEAIENRERLRPSMRGFKIANAKIARRVKDALKRVTDLEAKRTRVPTRVPVQEISEGDVIKLDTERKLLTDLLKMVAYQAESDLVRLITPHFSRVEDEGRTLVQNALATTGNIDVVDKELRIHLEPLSAPRRTKALLALCEQINATDTIYPGTDLIMRFDVQPEPPVSLAFPGSPEAAELSSLPKPDIPVEG